MKLKTKHELKAEEGESILKKWKSFFFYEEDASSTSNKKIQKSVRSPPLPKSETYFIVSVSDFDQLELIFSGQQTWQVKKKQKKMIKGIFTSSLKAFRRLARNSTIYIFFYVASEEAICNVSQLFPGKKRFQFGLINKEKIERDREKNQRIQKIL